LVNQPTPKNYDVADSPEDVLLVEALMGWDGDRCECPDRDSFPDTMGRE
jgi:hypothetical protein